MTTETKSAKNLFEEVFENVQKAAQANFEMQQEMFQKWAAGWTGLPQPQSAWLEKTKQIQKDWAKTVKELLNKHRDVVDEQYQLAVDSLDEAFRVAQSSDPQEYAKRCEALCRKTLEVWRESSELQSKEFQAALNKWLELATKSAS
jgi:hypothetical protein